MAGLSTLFVDVGVSGWSSPSTRRPQDHASPGVGPIQRSRIPLDDLEGAVLALVLWGAGVIPAQLLKSNLACTRSLSREVLTASRQVGDL
jgi:hypothetical protein